MNWFLVGSMALMGFVLSLLVTPLILKVAHWKDWMDHPNHRTVHTDPIPRLGVGLEFSCRLPGFFWSCSW